MTDQVTERHVAAALAPLVWGAEARCVRLGLADSRDGAIEIAERAVPGALGWVSNSATGEIWCGCNGEWKRVAVPQRLARSS